MVRSGLLWKPKRRLHFRDMSDNICLQYISLFHSASSGTNTPRRHFDCLLLRFSRYTVYSTTNWSSVVGLRRSCRPRPPLALLKDAVVAAVTAVLLLLYYSRCCYTRLLLLCAPAVAEVAVVVAVVVAAAAAAARVLPGAERLPAICLMLIHLIFLLFYPRTQERWFGESRRGRPSARAPRKASAPASDIGHGTSDH